MRVHIVFDKDGGIVAAVKLDSDAPVRVRPIADEQAGYRGADFYVPPELSHHDLADALRRLVVDPTGEFPELKTKR